MVTQSSSENYLKHNDDAVIKHMEMYQAIITRMASNSAACKKWCIPLITAILVFVVTEKLASLVWLTFLPILIFYLLDAYYLKLEKQFRNGFDHSADLIRKSQFSCDNLFQLKPLGSNVSLWLKAITSLSTWPVYFGLFVLMMAAYKMIS